MAGEFKPYKPNGGKRYKNQDRFFVKLRGVEYYYYFAFFITFTISCNQKGSVTLRMHQIRFSLGVCPGPRWGELMALPQSRVPSRLGRGILYPHSPPRRRLRRLTLSLKDCSKDLEG